MSVYWRINTIWRGNCECPGHLGINQFGQLESSGSANGQGMVGMRGIALEGEAMKGIWGCEGSDLEWQKRQIEAILYIFEGPLSRLLWALLFTFLSICFPKISNPFLPDTQKWPGRVIVSYRFNPFVPFSSVDFLICFLAAKIPIWWATWASKRWTSNGKHGYRRYEMWIPWGFW